MSAFTFIYLIILLSIVNVNKLVSIYTFILMCLIISTPEIFIFSIILEKSHDILYNKYNCIKERLDIMDINMMDKILEIFTKILIIFLILPVHEFAHAWAAHKMGDDTAAYAGRLTLNPLAHIDIVGALCLLLTPFGWAKPVPINPLKFKKQRLGVAVTAAAGPLSNLIVAFIATVIYRILANLPNAVEWYYGATGETTPFFILMYIIRFFISVNIGLAIFNLIPIPPLDGSKIVSYYTSAKFDRWIYNNQMIVNIVFLGIIVTGILDKPLQFLTEHVINFFSLITDFIPKLMGAN